MIKNFLNKICEKIIDAEDPDLDILRWLIYRQQYMPRFGDERLTDHEDSDDNASDYKYFKQKMIDACSSKGLIPVTTNHDIPDSQYEEHIYEYALKTIPKYFFNDYKAILYVYVLLFSPVGDNIHNAKEIFSPTPNIKFRSIVHPLDWPDNMSFPDQMVLILYLWFADICILSEYNTKIRSSSNDKSIIKIDEYSAYDLWEECCKKTSKNRNFFHDCKERTYEKISNLFVGFISGFNNFNFVFAPSFVTLFINNDLGYEASRKQILNKIKLPHDDYIVGLNPNDPLARLENAKSISEFLKLIIFPDTTSSPKTKIPFSQQFDKFIDDQLIRAESEEKFDGYVQNYLKSLSSDNREAIKKILVMSVYKSKFIYSYFDIFRYIYDSQDMFIGNTSTDPAMDPALSLLHLNIFTRWYDAVLLINDMPIWFCNYNSLYLKLLTTVSARMRERIENILKVSEIDIEKSISLKNTPISLEDIKHSFYQKAKNKLDQNGLIDILKGSDKKKYDVSSIYKCIFLLDNPNYSYEDIQSLLGAEKCIKYLRPNDKGKSISCILHDNFLVEYAKDINNCFFRI